MGMSGTRCEQLLVPEAEAFVCESEKVQLANPRLSPSFSFSLSLSLSLSLSISCISVSRFLSLGTFRLRSRD
jgi:hypothetical protein